MARVNVMRKHLILSIVILIAFLLSVALIAGVSAQQDSDNDGISDVLEEQLAKRYEPVLHFASGEEFFPTDVNYHIDNSELYMKLAESNMLIDASPTETSIAQYTTENYFLNNTLGGSERIAQDYTQKRGIYGDKIYAHVTSEGQNIVVQVPGSSMPTILEA